MWLLKHKNNGNLKERLCPLEKDGKRRRGGAVAGKLRGWCKCGAGTKKLVSVLDQLLGWVSQACMYKFRGPWLQAGLVWGLDCFGMGRGPTACEEGKGRERCV